jgi:adenosine deaminase CECR1
MRLAIALCVTACGFAAGFGEKFEEFKRTATPQELYRFLWAMPKGGDLHMHMGLSFWAADWYDAAKDRFYTRVRVSPCREEQAPLMYANVTRDAWSSMPPCEKNEYVPLREVPREAWISSLVLDRKDEGRDEFFERIAQRTAPLNRDTDAFVQVFRRSTERWAAENIRYVELMGQPRRPEEVPQLKRWAGEAPLVVRFLGIFIRFNDDAEARMEQVAALVNAHRDYWVGINMAGREDNDKGYPLRFLEPFREMRRQYPPIAVSLHAGEVDSPGTQVRDTLKLGATRIGHGVNLITDPDTMLLMRNGRILVETSLVSNRLLGYTPDLKKHPFIEYLRFGIPVCLNTDDQGSWDSSLTDEYFEAIRNFNLTWDEVVAIGRNSLQHAFAELSLKKKLLSDFESAISRFEQSESWRQAKPVISGYARENFFPN